MSTLLEKYERQGDKKNTDYFEEYLPKILERREKSGLDDLLTFMRAIVIQVSTGDIVPYLAELYLMTPYRFKKGYINGSHKIYILSAGDEYPDYFVLEPLVDSYRDYVSSLNWFYPRTREKLNTRYIGEIYHTKNLKETVDTLKSHDIRFKECDITANQFTCHPKFAFTQRSYYTNNLVGYTESDMIDYDSLELGEPHDLSPKQKEQLQQVSDLQAKYGLTDLILGIDHLATRVFSREREDAILEFLTLSNHYFWGAYTIEEMNSSTNICRNPNLEIDNELRSPAKVFTANNTSFYTKSIDDLPSPTEDFVRNFGRRLHHIAYAVVDGEQSDGTKNIDYVVNTLNENNVDFLAHIVGECKDFPDLKQIFSKSSKYSFLITEYVQRCHGFQGFFTKDNVADLTEAAGEDEALKECDVCD